MRGARDGTAPHAGSLTICGIRGPHHLLRRRTWLEWNFRCVAADNPGVHAKSPTRVTLGHRALTALALAALASLTITRASPPEPRSSAPLAITLTPTHAGNSADVDLAIGAPSAQLTAVFRNVGPETIRLWKDTCSWGYRNLSFEITQQDGQRFVVTRVERGWEKNVPAWHTLPAGTHLSSDITLNTRDWQGLPRLATGERRPVAVRALYKSGADYESKLNGVWVGSIVSEEIQATLENQQR